MTRTNLLPIFSSLLATLAGAACGDIDPGDRDDDSVQTGDGKADGTGVDVRNKLTPDLPVTVKLGATDRVGYVVFAGAGATLNVEVTQKGTNAGLDTHLLIHGPRGADGSYKTTLSEDTDAGFGKLSRIRGFTAPEAGHYLVEVRLEAGSPLGTARIATTCTSGDCAVFQPVAGHRNHTRWTEGAEWKALSVQSYKNAIAALEAKVAAGVASPWAVSVDVDETTMSNVTYEQERAAIGAGFSAAAWTEWTLRRAATPMPGAKAYLDRVHALGGKVMGVTNRSLPAGECVPTADNLAALGLVVDHLLCKTTTSDKNPRFQAIEDGSAIAGVPAMTLVQYVGDNIQDFPGLSQAVRTEPEAAFDEFGADLVILANSLYGSWQKNP